MKIGESYDILKAGTTRRGSPVVSASLVLVGYSSVSKNVSINLSEDEQRRSIGGSKNWAPLAIGPDVRKFAAKRKESRKLKQLNVISQNGSEKFQK